MGNSPEHCGAVWQQRIELHSMCERETVVIEHIAGPFLDKMRENLRRVSDVVNAAKAEPLAPGGLLDRPISQNASTFLGTNGCPQLAT